VSALVVAMAAGLVEMAARVSSDAGAAAQAESIRVRVAPLAAEDARAYEQALAAMRAPASSRSSVPSLLPMSTASARGPSPPSRTTSSA
jgi:formiminotetrahydrofolate cyclodeaminase